MEIVSPDEFDLGEPLDTMSPEYQKYRDAQGVPVHTQFYVKNVNELETGYWERTGQAGAFVNNYGCEGVSDLQIHELEPGGETTVQQHFYDQLIYVSEGNGFTSVGRDEDEVTFEWGTHAVFYVPQNAPYKFVNASDSETARLVAHTQLPQMLVTTRNAEFIDNCDYDFWTGDEGYYDPEASVSQKSGREHGHLSNLLWDANFIPDMMQFDNLVSTNANIFGVVRVANFPFSGSNSSMHLAEFPTGMYKKAHWHAPAYNIFILYGSGYELMWPPEGGDQILKMEYEPMSVLTPPAGWWHHHFHTADKVTGQLAMHSPEIGTLMARNGIFNPQGSFNNIEYVDEDPFIREHYKEVLESKGLEFRMPDEIYENPDFDLGRFIEEENPFAEADA